MKLTNIPKQRELTGKYHTIHYNPTPEQLAEWEKKREEIKKKV